MRLVATWGRAGDGASRQRAILPYTPRTAHGRAGSRRRDHQRAQQPDPHPHTRGSRTPAVV